MVNRCKVCNSNKKAVKGDKYCDSCSELFYGIAKSMEVIQKKICDGYFMYHVSRVNNFIRHLSTLGYVEAVDRDIYDDLMSIIRAKYPLRAYVTMFHGD